MDVRLENNQVVMTKVHEANDCIGPQCSLHNRSNHPMREFPQVWRSDRHLMERQCPHGIGHPDPDDPKIYNAPEGKNYELIHGCDGCCDGSYSVVS
jgi:hypothetical protein